jgi:hypothetical protein
MGRTILFPSTSGDIVPTDPQKLQDFPSTNQEGEFENMPLQIRKRGEI